MTRLILGDCLNVLKTLPDGSVHCCVTSPPYWGLRDYGCDGQIGLEATPDAFVGRMVEVFREVRRVLRDDGTLWLNLGDSYARWGTDAAKGPGANFDGKPGAAYPMTNAGCKRYGLKHKDLVGIPWRVAFALQADGWYLRSDIIWAKPNPMPESVRDRPTKSHEYLFLMAKSERYYWDAEAVREPFQTDPRENYPARAKIVGRGCQAKNCNGQQDKSGGYPPSGAGRNIRSVWTIATRAYKGAHFATFPPRLIEPCIKAGTSERGCCPGCGKPWGRVVERTPDNSGYPSGPGGSKRYQAVVRGSAGTLADVARYRSETLGWRPTCDHGRDPVPCVVLDPFMGSGTTGAVAAELGRDFIGIELNPAYLALAEARLAEAQPDHPLFAGASA